MEGSCQSTLTVVISNSIQNSAEKIQTRPVLQIAFQTLKKTIQMFIIIPAQYRIHYSTRNLQMYLYIVHEQHRMNKDQNKC